MISFRTSVVAWCRSLVSSPIKVVSSLQVAVITSIQLKVTLARSVQMSGITVSEPDIVYCQPVLLVGIGWSDGQTDSDLDVGSLQQSSCDKGPVSGGVTCLRQGSLTGRHVLFHQFTELLLSYLPVVYLYNLQNCYLVTFLLKDD